MNPENRVVIEVNNGVASILHHPIDIDVYIVDRDTVDFMTCEQIDEHLEGYPLDMRSDLRKRFSFMAA